MSVQPARPSHFPYQLKALLDVPRRIFRPPNPPVPRQRVGRVRRFSLTPVYEVNLEDVLAGKHLPPLALPEFQSYLMYTERSPENLHFMLWFRDYVQRYQEWSRSLAYPQHSPSLAYSYSRAKQSFFTPSAPLELNLPADTLAALFEAAPRAHPSPSAFADIRRQVESMLTESLHNFVRSRSANAGRNRGLFAIFVGLCAMCVGLAPILLSALGGRSTWLRFAALPCFWFGATTLICGLHGVCIVIFLFGDARQLTTYELARPKISHVRLCRNDSQSMSHKRLSNTSSRQRSPVDFVELSLPKPIRTPDSPRFYIPQPVTIPNSSEPTVPSDVDVSLSHAPREKCSHVSARSYFPPSPTSPASIAPFLSMPPAEPASKYFDFDHITSSWPPSQTHLPSSPPVFGPLTKALNLISIRTYWETVVRSAALALLLACILVGVAVGVSAT